MPNKRRQDEEAELKRRRAQSKRDKAKHRQEQDEIDRVIARWSQQSSAEKKTTPTPLATKPPSFGSLDDNMVNKLKISIKEARSNKFIRNVAEYAPHNFT
jgi:hypothetical protein